MSAPKLSICIATLNRAAFIGETLKSIIAQATDDVEIVVVDGASTDNTTAVVCSYQQKFPRLNYVRLEAKGGVDRDYDRSVQLAQGEYCWLMSDDDLLKPGAIQAVLNAIDENYGLIVVNAEVRSSDFSELIVPGLLPTDRDRIYTPADWEKLFVDVATFMSFIGCVVIKRELWNAREREKYYGTEFIHIGVIFSSPLPARARYLACPGITIRHGNASWSSRYFQIWMFKWPQIVWSFANYSDAAKRKVCPAVPWQSPKILTILRAKGAYSTREYENFLQTRLTNPRQRFLARLIVAMPGCLVNLPVLIYFSLFRSQQLYGLAEFRSSPFYYKNCLRRLFKLA